jgi:hypothetical protein
MRPRGERGALELVYNRETGKPLTVPLDTTMDQLRRCVDPGRYRLDPVAENGQQPEDAPAAYVEVIRPRQAAIAYDGEDGPSDDGWSDDSLPGRSAPNTEREAMRLTVRLAESVIKSASSATSSCVASPPVPTLGLHDLVAELVRANTRMAELVIQGVPSMLTAAGGLITAADGASLPMRRPLPPPPEPERESAESDERAEEVAPAFGIPEVVRLLIKETVDKVVPLIFEKLTSGAGLGGLPLEALLDWRKAVPNPAAAPSAPAAPTASSTPPPPEPANWPTSAAAASYAATSPPSPSAPGPAGATPSRESPPGAAPADPPAPPVASSPRSQEDAAAMINAHVLNVWQGLSPPERARAGQLIARLTPEERMAWLAELARLTVPEAIMRARAIIHAQTPPTPTTPQLSTATPQGDPS